MLKLPKQFKRWCEKTKLVVDTPLFNSKNKRNWLTLRDENDRLYQVTWSNYYSDKDLVLVIATQDGANYRVDFPKTEASFIKLIKYVNSPLDKSYL